MFRLRAMLKNEIDIPEGVEAVAENHSLNVRGPRGELKRTFRNPLTSLRIEAGKVVISSNADRKKAKAVIGTWSAHVNNMFTGVRKGWKGELKLVYSHFPVKMKTDAGNFIIENFLGEKSRRKVPVPEDLKVEVKESNVYVSGADKERVGQLCARIEQSTKVRGYDRRVFQDGIYITRKPYPEGENE